MEFRSMFKNIFGINGPKEKPQYMENMQLINGYNNTITRYNFSNSDLTRTCVDCIAKHISKLKPVHIRNTQHKAIINSNLNTLLSNRPNPYNSTADFLYKIATQAFLHGNALIYVQKNNNGDVTALYPLDFATLELKEQNNILFCMFYFNGSMSKKVVPYTDLIHIRKNYIDDEFWGQSPQKTLKETLEMLSISRQSIGNKINNSGKISGILKIKGSIGAKNWLQAAKDFATAFKNLKNDTAGIAAIDSSTDFITVPTTVDSAEDTQINFLQEEIYKFFGLNKSIISGDYTEQQWQSFFETTLEPFLIQLDQEFTEKLFTKKEQKHGNKIYFNSNRLAYMSTQNKVSMIKELSAIGLLTINESRELFDLDPIEDGNKRLVSLNYVNADKADQYQLEGRGKVKKCLN